MTKRLHVFVISLCLTVFTSLVAKAVPMPPSFADLVEEKSPAVVNISTAIKPKKTKNTKQRRMPQHPFSGDPLFDRFFEDFFGGLENFKEFAPSMPQQSLGSGVVISADGYIVTNHHVVDKADDIVVRFQDDSELKAKLVGKDKKNDLALLKVETDKDLKFVTLGNSDKVRVGDWAIAIGNPFGLGGSVTAGIISARGRNIHQGPYDDFLQTDAAINPGNSGGPLFDQNGEVVGINTAILSRSGGSQGIGFAVPSNTVKLIVEQIKEHGRPVRGWLGVRIQTVTSELAEAMDLKEAKGALVAAVVEGSPAAKAGLKEGDLILSFDAQPVKEMEDLPKMVAETSIGKKVEISFRRGDNLQRVQVVIDELNEDEEGNIMAENEALGEAEVAGMTLSDLDEDERDALGLESDVQGVVVTSVEYDSRAALSGLRAGDVIIEIAKQKVKTVKDVQTILDDSKDKSLLMLIIRGGNKHFIAFKKISDDE